MLRARLSRSTNRAPALGYPLRMVETGACLFARVVGAPYLTAARVLGLCHPVARATIPPRLYGATVKRAGGKGGGGAAHGSKERREGRDLSIGEEPARDPIGRRDAFGLRMEPIKDRVR